MTRCVFLFTPLPVKQRKVQQPEISQFLDVRKYLADYYTWRKTTDTKFSFSTWAQEMGFKSRTFLQLVVSGKRSITSRTIPLFIQGLQLNEKESQYFENLVGFSQANTVTERSHYAQKLFVKSRSKIKNHFQFLSSPLCPRVLTLVSLKGWKPTETHLAKTLGVSVSQIKRTIEVLVRLDLVEKKETYWISKTDLFEVDDQIGDQALQLFHKECMQEAIESIDLPPSTRRQRAVLVPLSPKEFERLDAQLCQFSREILSKFSAEQVDNRRLYQLNLHLVPVSETILHSTQTKNDPSGDTLTLNLEQKESLYEVK